MIKIRAGFIEDINGNWINISHVKTFYFFKEEMDFSHLVKNLDQPYAYRFDIIADLGSGHYYIISKHKKEEEAKEQLDAIMDSLDYIRIN